MLDLNFRKNFVSMPNPMSWAQVGCELMTCASHCRLIRTKQKESRMLHRATQHCLQEKQMLTGAGWCWTGRVTPCG